MASEDAWAGGRELPYMRLDERERRAIRIRENWTERKKIAARFRPKETSTQVARP